MRYRGMAWLASTALLMIGCEKRPTSESRPQAQSSRNPVTINAWDNPLWSPDQSDALKTIATESGAPLTVLPWEVGQAPLQISTYFAIDTNDITDSVRQFIIRFAPLWHISSSDIDSRIRFEQIDGECTSVIVTLWENNQRVHNATLRFDIIDTKIRNIIGYFDGRPTPNIAPLTISEPNARKYLGEEKGLPSDATSELYAEVVIFDDYFLGSDARNPQEAYAFSATKHPDLETAVVLNNSRLGFNGVPFSDEQVSIFDSTLCNAPQQTGWYAAVTVDSLLHTPAWVSLRGVGGQASLADTLMPAPERVISLMQTAHFQQMYGDAAPEDHLYDPEVRTDGDATTVTFKQQFGGFRVEGPYLTAVFENNRIVEVFSRLPNFPTYAEPLINIASAREAARAAYLQNLCPTGNTDCRTTAGKFATALSEDTVVFVSELIDQPGKHGAFLAYRFEYDLLTVWWGANPSQLLRIESKKQHSTQTHYWTWTGQTAASSDGQLTHTENYVGPPAFRLDTDHDGTGLSTAPPYSIAVHDFISTIDEKYRNLYSWDSFVGDGRMSTVNSNAVFEVMLEVPSTVEASADYAYINNNPDLEFPLIEIGSDMYVGDIIAHEYTHLVTRNAVGFYAAQEQGALDEHYSDVFANAIFPDNNDWYIAELARIPRPIRNMLNPTDPGTAEGPQAIDHVSNQGNCNAILKDCQYPWMGIPNKAFALSVVGAPPPFTGGVPLPLETASKLYFETIRKSPYQMFSTDRFINQRAKIVSACGKATRPLVGPDGLQNQTRARIGTVTLEQCQNVISAFDSVGVLAGTTHGLSTFPTYVHTTGTNQALPVSQWIGSRFKNGCAIDAGSHVLNVTVSGYNLSNNSTVQFSSPDTQDPPLHVTVNRGEIDAVVTKRCGNGDSMSCPDPYDRGLITSVKNKWTNDVLVYVDEFPDVPPDVATRRLAAGEQNIYCYVDYPPLPDDPPPTPRYYATTPIMHLSGGAGTGLTIEPAATPVCPLDDWGFIDDHKGGAVPLPVTLAQEWAHPAHGVYGTRIDPNNPFDYRIDVRLWADSFSAIYSRVIYKVMQPYGQNCDLPGMFPIDDPYSNQVDPP